MNDLKSGPKAHKLVVCRKANEARVNVGFLKGGATLSKFPTIGFD